jgi:hypothetical protein
MQHKKKKKKKKSPYKLHITFTTTKNQTCNTRNKKTNTFFSFETSHHFYKEKNTKKEERGPMTQMTIVNSKTTRQNTKNKKQSERQQK